MVVDLALVNAGELVTCSGSGSEGLGIFEDGSLVVEDGRVAWIGTTKEFRRKSFGRVERSIDVKGALVTPGFVDPHTHLAFAGTREDEFEKKIKGASYTQILKSGGGILRTITETRKASVKAIADASAARMKQLVRNGVTTMEVKTGYGQRLEQEMKLLSVINWLGERGGAEVVATFLGLHATPPEFKNSKDYVRYAVNEMLPAVASRPRAPAFSDCFCEDGVFSAEECRKYLRASAKLGLARKIHADEFGDSGGASLAAETGCTSADHLGRSEDSGLGQMARKGVTAVLLPGTSLYSGIPYANARAIMDAGCSVALGTDLSPNSWIESPQVVMAIACNAMKMTPAQALLGFTRNAARAISRPDIGCLTQGCSADFVVHNLPSYRFLAYRVGGSYIGQVFKRGKEIHRADPS